MRQYYLLVLLFVASACGAVTQPCPVEAKRDVIYVTGQGWHAEIGIPVEELDDNLAIYKSIFSGAQVIMFGYGKKTFITASADTVSEYCLGPVPGPAVVHVVGLRKTPIEAYPPGDTLTLALPPGGAKALSAYVWAELAKDASGKPQIVARSSNPDGMFYAARTGYSLLHTCNSWTAQALQAAGLPVSPHAVIFSGQVMNRAQEAAHDQCRSLP